MRSVSVVLPESMCAEIPMLRSFFMSYCIQVSAIDSGYVRRRQRRTDVVGALAPPPLGTVASRRVFMVDGRGTYALGRQRAERSMAERAGQERCVLRRRSDLGAKAHASRSAMSALAKGRECVARDSCKVSTRTPRAAHARRAKDENRQLRIVEQSPQKRCRISSGAAKSVTRSRARAPQ